MNFITIQAQLFQSKTTFASQDSLRGMNGIYRKWWDVHHYDIKISPNYHKQFLSGVNSIQFTALENGQKMQLDLQTPMQIDRAYIENNTLSFIREGNVYWLLFEKPLLKGETYTLIVDFSGKPKIAKNAPWDGGWLFTEDDEGNPWMSVACQGLGASVWYPNKDYLGDEPDKGMRLQIELPVESNLSAVSNGLLINSTNSNSEKIIYTWEVKSPINNYNIVPYIGNYTSFKNSFNGEGGILNMTHYVLKQHLLQAQKQFTQLEDILKAFEYWFGAYPFYQDSFKIVEAPYLGMEHQSAIAYGNQFVNGYLGADLSDTGVGLSWDFILVHETGHEWFGNNISIKDIADMWIHEGFTTYAETLFVEYTQGKTNANKYIIGQRRNILNDKPIIGSYGINQEGSSDMYYKGANMIHTLRQWVNNDVLFRKTLQKMNTQFKHKTVTGKEIEQFLANSFNLNLDAFFKQYLYEKDPPILVYKLEHQQLQYRWITNSPNFEMPIKTIKGKILYPKNDWQTISYKEKDLQIDPNYYIEIENTK